MATYRISFSLEEGYNFIVDAVDVDAAYKQFLALKYSDVEELVKQSKHKWSDVQHTGTEEM